MTNIFLINGSGNIAILNIISNSLIWLSIGILSYFLLSDKWKKLINKLTWLELSVILFTIYTIISLVTMYLALGVSSNIEHDYINWMSANGNGKSGEVMNNYNKAVDGGIMIAAASGGFKLAAKAPTPILKTAAVGLGLTAGGLGIGIKNVVGNVTQDIGKSSNTSKFIFDFPDISNTIFTDNNLYDLLTLTHYANTIAIISLCFYLYNSILILLTSDKIAGILKKVNMPTTIINFITKFNNYLLKSRVILQISFIIIAIFSCGLSYYSTDYIISNYDAICEYYIINKK